MGGGGSIHKVGKARTWLRRSPTSPGLDSFMAWNVSQAGIGRVMLNQHPARTRPFVIVRPQTKHSRVLNFPSSQPYTVYTSTTFHF